MQLFLIPYIKLIVELAKRDMSASKQLHSRCKGDSNVQGYRVLRM